MSSYLNVLWVKYLQMYIVSLTFAYLSSFSLVPAHQNKKFIV